MHKIAPESRNAINNVAEMLPFILLLTLFSRINSEISYISIIHPHY
jgi:hypothetical protein